MDSGLLLSISLRLLVGAVACFLAILLWSRTRDIAWMLLVGGTVASYADTVYTILERFGVSGPSWFTIGSMSLAAIVLPLVPTLFYISAFWVMIVRKYRKH